MTTKSRIISAIVIIAALTVYNTVILYTSASFEVNYYVKLVAYLLNIPLIIAASVGIWGNYRQLLRWVICISVLFCFMSIAYYVIFRYKLISRFNSTEKIQLFLSKYGTYAGLIYILIQFLQVTFIPVPAAITTMAGVALFGIWKTFFYSVVGIMLGSLFAFYLGKKYGTKLFVWLMGERAYVKYHKLADGKDKVVLTMMFLFPLFPDDLLCIAAGLTNMTYFQFFIIMLIARPLNILAMEGTFKGISAIPLRGYGIPIWIALISLTLIVVIIAFKYSGKIENACLKLFDKISSKVRHNRKENEKADIERVHKSVYDRNRLEEEEVQKTHNNI